MDSHKTQSGFTPFKNNFDPDDQRDPDPFYDFVFRFIVSISVAIFLMVPLQGDLKKDWLLVIMVSLLYAGLASGLVDKENDNNTLTYGQWTDGKKAYDGRKTDAKYGIIHQARVKLYADVLFYFAIYFLAALLFSIVLQMAFGPNWMLMIPVILVTVPLGVYLKCLEEIEEFLILLRTCQKCGSINSGKSYYCPKCGFPMEKNYERIVEVYFGYDSIASAVMQALVDNNIVAWKNTLYRGGMNLPSSVFVFEEDAGKAGDIVYLIDSPGEDLESQ